VDKVLLERFFRAVSRQFIYGGVKYAQTSEKEATDCLFDDFGKNWLFGTIAKYCKRYSNLKREKDLLKISCYMFILWLKRGFHYGEFGTHEIINTTVEVKSRYFITFKERFNEYLLTEDFGWNTLYQPNAIQRIYDILMAFANVSFHDIQESDLMDIFYLAYYVWDTQIPENEKEKDEDVGKK